MSAPTNSPDSEASKSSRHPRLNRWNGIATLLAPYAVLTAGCGLLWWVFGRSPVRAPDFISESLVLTGMIFIACGGLALRDRWRFLATYAAFCRCCESSVPMPDAEFAAELEDCDPEVAIRARQSMAPFFGVASDRIRPEQPLNVQSWQSPFRWMFEHCCDEEFAAPDFQGRVIAWHPPQGPLVSDYVRSLCVAIKEFRNGATVGNP